MIRFRSLGFVSLIGLGTMGVVRGVPDAQAAGTTKSAVKPPPTVHDTIRLTPEGLHFGMTTTEVVEFYSRVLDQDYVPIYKRTPIGVKMKEVDAALADEKAAIARSEVTFGAVPTGIDNTPLKGEYSYKNNETMMSVVRQGVTRYFFFQNKRLWKTYDTVPLREGSDLGATYDAAVAALNKRFAVKGRTLAQDAEHGRSYPETDWVDAVTHVRAIDRSYEKMVGLVYEERVSADRLAAYRASQKGQDGQIDPQIAALSSGGSVVDPNAAAADAYTGRAHAPAPSAAPPAAPPKKK
jgi:hypothetical protein